MASKIRADRLVLSHSGSNPSSPSSGQSRLFAKDTAYPFYVKNDGGTVYNLKGQPIIATHAGDQLDQREIVGQLNYTWKTPEGKLLWMPRTDLASVEVSGNIGKATTPSLDGTLGNAGTMTAQGSAEGSFVNFATAASAASAGGPIYTGRFFPKNYFYEMSGTAQWVTLTTMRTFIGIWTTLPTVDAFSDPFVGLHFAVGSDWGMQFVITDGTDDNTLIVPLGFVPAAATFQFYIGGKNRNWRWWIRYVTEPKDIYSGEITVEFDPWTVAGYAETRSSGLSSQNLSSIGCQVTTTAASAVSFRVAEFNYRGNA